MRKTRCTQKPANQLTTRILRRFGDEHQGPHEPREGPSRAPRHLTGLPMGIPKQKWPLLSSNPIAIYEEIVKLHLIPQNSQPSPTPRWAQAPNLAGAILGAENASQCASVARRWSPSRPQRAPKGAQMLYFTRCSRHAPKPPGASRATCPAHLKPPKGVSKVPH